MHVEANRIKQEYYLSRQTLALWASDGWIGSGRGPRGRLYNVADVDTIFRAYEQLGKPAISIGYTWVSSAHEQTDGDLRQQICDLEQAREEIIILHDVSSGRNFSRPGFAFFLERVYRGDVAEVVVTHKDRLCCCGVEFCEWLCSETLYHKAR